jgi:membrane fusion protein, multidrug efflux system
MNDEQRGPAIVADTAETLDTISRSRRQRLFAGRRLMVVVAVLLALILIAWLLTPKTTSAPRGRFGAGGPMPVAEVPARTGNMPMVLNGLGTVTPLATVTVQSQINGQITQIAFKEGQSVKRGDALIQIDPRPYQVALEQAQGALERDKALLANAKTDLTRYQTLYSQDSVAEQQLATQKALVIQDEGTVKTDQGQIDSARLNLIYCHIVSPVDGRVGLQQVNLGNYVTPAEPNGLVVVTQLRPITVVFTLAEDQIPPILKQLHAGRIPTVTAYDRSHTTQLATGTLQTIDNEIDTTTGTVKLKALFANDDGSLFPNQFVNVDLLVDTLNGATLIPQSAVQRGAPGTYVYAINPDHTVSVRKVTLGPGDATDVAITQGLKPGDLVVVDGADRLKDGAKVLPRQSGTQATPVQGQSQGKKQGQHQHRRNNRDDPNDHGSQPASQ